ncbi:MAG: hypothetical protein ACKO37_03415 [Vampirovibrionales bacterium]
MLEVNFTAVLVFISLVPFVFLMKGLFFDPMLRIQAQRESLREQESSQSLDFVVTTLEVKERVTQLLKHAKKQAQVFILQARQRVQQDIQSELLVFRNTQEAQVAQEKQVLDEQFHTSRAALSQAPVSELSQAILATLRSNLG